MHCTTVSLQSRLILLITAAEKAYTTYAQSLNAVTTIVRPTDATTDRVATRETNAECDHLGAGWDSGGASGIAGTGAQNPT